MKKYSILFCLTMLLSQYSYANEGSGSSQSNGGGNGVTVSRKGKNIIDKDGKLLQLKGIAFGNEVWSNNPLPPYTHHNEQDFQRVEDMGMNVIRFYMNYRIFEDDSNPYHYKQEGWDWIDQNIKWAKKHNIYLILNMHIPQGGFQSNGKGGALWNEPENQKRLKALWHHIAKKYASENIIAGFDLLNEPVVTVSKNQWQNFAQGLVDTIRAADKKHMIVVERVNAIGHDWENDSDLNFVIANDDNVMYEFHFYSPIEYSHQLTSWTGFGEGGKYPDNDIISLGGNSSWYSAIHNNPTAKEGNSDWTFLQGLKFKINDEKIKIAKPALVAKGVGVNGKVYFDDVVIKEYDENEKYVRDVLTVNMSSSNDWYYWSFNNTGSATIDQSTGHTDKNSVVMQGSTEDCNYSNWKQIFIPKQGYYYEISGWVKGENVSANASCKIRIDFETSEGAIYGRNKQYLESVIKQYVDWREKHQVPLYCGEFGLYIECFKNNKGGIQWTNDVIDLLKKYKLHYTYHSYHEDSFGLYYGYGRPVNPNDGNMELKRLFESKLK